MKELRHRKQPYSAVTSLWKHNHDGLVGVEEVLELRQIDLLVPLDVRGDGNSAIKLKE